MISAKNQTGGFQNGLGSDLVQQLLDEEEGRAASMQNAKKAGAGYGGASMNLASMELLGTGGSLGR